MSRRYAHNEPNDHARNDRDDRVMDCAYSLDLQVIRCPEGKDEKEADEKKRPGRVKLFLLWDWGWRGRVGCGGNDGGGAKVNWHGWTGLSILKVAAGRRKQRKR